MQDQQKFILRYAAFWLWILAVSAGVWFVYTSILQVVPDLLMGLLGFDHKLFSNLGDNTTVWWMLRQVLFVLLWWRAVKVFVLHGSPFHIGLTISKGRENKNQTGGLTHHIWIGDPNVYINEYKGQFWYGAVFKAHPNSDKLMRSRLKLLVIALPFGYTLVIQESRVYLKKDSHEGRAKRYRLVADEHSSTRDHTTPDRFRTEALRQLRYIGQYFEEEKRVKRIDGLRWYSYMGGGGYVMDDFSHRLSFEYLEEEKKYKVKELGPNADGEKVVDSISELRAIVKADFQSTWDGGDIESGVGDATTHRDS